MPKQRQRTLFEFVSGSSSPLKQSSPHKGKLPPIVIESDDDDSDPGRIKFEPEASKDSYRDHTDVEEGRKSVAPRRSGRLLASQKGASPSVSPSRSTSSEREVLPRKSNHSGRNKRLLVTSDESDDQRTVKRRRLVKGKRPDSLSDVDHDENLVDEVDEDKILASRLRGRPKKTDFVRNLERLQRRRRGEASDTPDEDSEDDGSGFSSDSPPVTSDQPFKGAHPTNEEEDITAEGTTPLNAENDDFIVEDADDEEIPELPTQFSMGTFQDLSHHFKVICQFFVHLAILAPHRRRSFMEQEMKKDYFSVPLAIARRKLSAMKDSLVTSSIWKPDFKKPLESSPEFRLEDLEFSIPRCDACHIGNRIATLRGVSRRCKYDRTTFELLEEIDAESDQESDEFEWNLGRFCAARAQVFHLFSHWEYILFHSLREEVEGLQAALSPGKKTRVFLPATKGAPPPDDPNDADGIMDWLDGRGVINSQWIKVKSMMNRARKLEVGREAGEDLEIG